MKPRTLLANILADLLLSFNKYGRKTEYVSSAFVRGCMAPSDRHDVLTAHLQLVTTGPEFVNV
jgi:hypothetical protein